MRQVALAVFKHVLPCFSGRMPGDLAAMCESCQDPNFDQMFQQGGPVYELLVVLGRFKFLMTSLLSNWQRTRKTRQGKDVRRHDSAETVLEVLRATAKTIAGVDEEEHRLWTSQVGIGTTNCLGFIPLLKALCVASLAGNEPKKKSDVLLPLSVNGNMYRICCESDETACKRIELLMRAADRLDKLMDPLPTTCHQWNLKRDLALEDGAWLC